ncbi:3-oxoacyl-[acyl-carrier-protein] reductase FabG, partial [Haemophilus influenzae]
GGGAKQ